MVAGTSTRQGRALGRQAHRSVASGVKRAWMVTVAPCMQRGRGLDVEPADMEERQHGEDVIARRQVVHVLAHHAVPHQRFLPQHRAFGTAGGAGRVDDQQRARRDRYAGCGRRRLPAASRAVERTAAVRREIEADHARRRAARLASGAMTAAKPFSTTSTLTRRVGEDEQLLRHREPPVERHQHRAEPRAGIEQHEIVGMIERQDRDAVAAADAELGFQRARRLRSMRVVKRGIGSSVAAFESESRSCRA